jgi:Lon protease-like protein
VWIVAPEYLDVPIFLLPNVTLFPQAYLPLHIFERRYRALVGAALQGDRMIGVALLREGWQRDYFGKPPIYRTLGIGKIVDADRLHDGRFNIMLQGMYRGRLIEEYPTEDYRVGHVAILADLPIDQRRREVAELQKEMLELCRKIAEMAPSLRQSSIGSWSSHPHPAVVTDLLASTLVVDAYDRQSILEETDPLRRNKLTLVQLRMLVQKLLQRDEIEEEVLEEDQS